MKDETQEVLWHGIPFPEKMKHNKACGIPSSCNGVPRAFLCSIFLERTTDGIPCFYTIRNTRRPSAFPFEEGQK